MEKWTLNDWNIGWKSNQSSEIKYKRQEKDEESKVIILRPE